MSRYCSPGLSMAFSESIIDKFLAYPGRCVKIIGKKKTPPRFVRRGLDV
jgi:hypothetical protein